MTNSMSLDGGNSGRVERHKVQKPWNKVGGKWEKSAKMVFVRGWGQQK